MPDINVDSLWLRERVGGFLAGIASGITKLLVGHPFDTVKLRLQTEGRHGRFGGSLWKCVQSTIRSEGVRGFYRGATPPLFGWALMDSVMLGSLTNFQRILRDRKGGDPLSYWEHAVAGMGAGGCVCFVATPIENTKARLQVQYDAASTRYRGPIDCVRQSVQVRGVVGLYRGFGACLLFRSFFAVLWSSYEFYTRFFTFTVQLKQHQQLQGNPQSSSLRILLSESLVPFLSGGMAATTFWAIAFPADVIKNRIMSQPETRPLRYPNIRTCAKMILKADGIRGFYCGFLSCMLRSFPTNGAALFVFDFFHRKVLGKGI